MRFLGKLIMVLTLAIAGLGITQPAIADTQDSWILDESGVINKSRLIKEVDTLDPEIHYAFIVTDDPAVQANNYDDTIYTYALKKLPNELKDDQQLATNVVVITVSPEMRKLGVYAHDNLGLSSSHVSAITESMKSPARAGKWTETLITGAQSANSELTEPKAEHKDKPIFIPYWLLAALPSAGILVAISFGLRRRNDRKRIEAETKKNLMDYQMPTKEAAQKVRDVLIEAHDKVARSDLRNKSVPLRQIESDQTLVRSYLENYDDYQGERRLNKTLANLTMTSSQIEEAPSRVRSILIDRKIDDTWKKSWSSYMEKHKKNIKTSRLKNHLESKDDEKAWNREVDSVLAQIAAIDKEIKTIPEYTLSEAKRNVDKAINSLKQSSKQFANRYYKNHKTEVKSFKKDYSSHDYGMYFPLLFMMEASNLDSYSHSSSSFSSSSHHSSSYSDYDSSSSSSFSSFGGDSGGSASF